MADRKVSDFEVFDAEDGHKSIRQRTHDEVAAAYEALIDQRDALLREAADLIGQDHQHICTCEVNCPCPYEQLRRRIEEAL